MNTKYYRINIWLQGGTRTEVTVEAENVYLLMDRLRGAKMNFINKKAPDRKSFTLYSHSVIKMEYEESTLVSGDPYGVYDIHL